MENGIQDRILPQVVGSQMDDMISLQRLSADK
jgi:hypothetical protein